MSATGQISPKERWWKLAPPDIASGLTFVAGGGLSSAFVQASCADPNHRILAWGAIVSVTAGLLLKLYSTKSGQVTKAISRDAMIVPAGTEVAPKPEEIAGSVSIKDLHPTLQEGDQPYAGKH